MTLQTYKQKRKLNETPEPKPAPRRKGGAPHLVFVVHKHAARRLHYDLRLELQGVLKSFAVPKGPSLDPSIKRLAVMVEDHPFDYKDFEGNIPEGNYGAGAVMIWDRGLYGHPLAKDKKESEKLLLEGLKKGDMKFVIAGSKLKGEFALVKTRWDQKSWLLLKKKDKYADATDVLKKDRSVISHKTLEEISQSPQEIPSGQERSNRTNDQKPPMLESIKDVQRRPMPHNLRPMLAATVKEPFNHPAWIFEIKWDGYRAIAETGKKHVLLYSRNQKSLINKFFPVVDSLQKLGFEAVLDGEIVAVNNAGLPDFQMLQDFRKTGRGRLIYYVFDILFYEGRDVTSLPLFKRKELLKKILPSTEHVKFSDHVWNDGVSFFDAAKKKGLEGIMAKYSKSAYQEGIRSGNWLKIKNRLEQDCVIAGFTEPRGARKYIGSLVLGAFEEGRFVYVGHSGGGFGNESLQAIYEKLKPLIRNNCPFSIKPPEDTPVTWVKPILVCEFAFTGWTKDNIMRQPVFVRFREDKNAEEAIHEPSLAFTTRDGKERGKQ